LEFRKLQKLFDLRGEDSRAETPLRLEHAKILHVNSTRAKIVGAPERCVPKDDDYVVVTENVEISIRPGKCTTSSDEFELCGELTKNSFDPLRKALFCAIILQKHSDARTFILIGNIQIEHQKNPCDFFGF